MANASLSHLRRVTTEERSSATGAWIRGRVRCRRWVPKIRRLWQRVQVDCEWPAHRASTIRALISDSRATPALLEFLSDTRVGWMPSQVVLRGEGAEDDDEGLEIELWAPEEGAVDEGSEEEDGPGQPF